MKYIVRAFDKFNNEIILIVRNTETKAIQTALFWNKRGAKYCTIDTEEWQRIAWIEKENIEYNEYYKRESI